MANRELLNTLKTDLDRWNTWRVGSSVVPDLSEACLKDAKLDGANLSRANLSKADLRGASLIGAILNEANLRKARLQNANLRHALLFNAILHKADLSDAVLSGAIFFGADLREVIIKEVNFRGVDIRNAKLNRVDLSGLSLVGTNLTGTVLRNSMVKNVDLSNTNLSNTDFSNADISGSNLTGANLHNWKIEGIKCTRVIWNNKEIKYEKPDDFEKVFTEMANVVEIFLDLPFSSIGYMIGRIIEKTLNQKYGEGIAIFKGHTAISDDATKFEFLGDPKKNNEILKTLSQIQIILNPVFEEFKTKKEPQNLLGLKKEIDFQDLLSLNFLVLRPKEISSELVARYARLHPLIQQIINTIQLHIN